MYIYNFYILQRILQILGNYYTRYGVKDIVQITLLD